MAKPDDVEAEEFVAFVLPSLPASCIVSLSAACPVYRIINTQSLFASLSVRANVNVNADGHDPD
jgi:hypothetical protein